MYQVWLESLDIYLSYHPETKIWACLEQITPSKFDEICPLVISNQISTISIHIPSLVKIHWCILKLSFGNEIQTYGWSDTGTSNVKPMKHRHYCVVGYKKFDICNCIYPKIGTFLRMKLFTGTLLLLILTILALITSTLDNIFTYSFFFFFFEKRFEILC